MLSPFGMLRADLRRTCRAASNSRILWKYRREYPLTFFCLRFFPERKKVDNFCGYPVDALWKACMFVTAWKTAAPVHTKRTAFPTAKTPVSKRFRPLVHVIHAPTATAALSIDRIYRDTPCAHVKKASDRQTHRAR